MIKAAPQISDLLFQADIRAALARDGMVHIPNFLNEDFARALVAPFDGLPWLATFREGETPKQIAADKIPTLDANERRAMIVNMHRQAVSEFQYFYETFRFLNEYENGRLREGPLAEFARDLNAPGTHALFAALTGDDRIAYVDGQATRYVPGQFLIEHDDTDGESARLYAYVLNLSPQWRTDWGGLLMFLDDEGNVRRAYPPRWNAINIFRVPQRHAVSFVAPYAGAARNSITGWMRAKP